MAIIQFRDVFGGGSLRQHVQTMVNELYTFQPHSHYETCIHIPALAAGVDLDEVAIWTNPTFTNTALETYRTLRSVTIHALDNSAGIDGSNTSEWVLKKNDTSVVSLTFNAVTLFPDKTTLHTNWNDVYSSFDPGDVIKLSITNGTTAATPAVNLVFHYTTGVVGFY
jgi:hypothetical protein